MKDDAAPASYQVERWLQERGERKEGLLFVDKPPALDVSPQSGFATSLYTLCLGRLSQLTNTWVEHRSSRARSRAETRLKEVQRRLYLFGDSFEAGKLESCLNADDELCSATLGLLADIGKILAHGK